AHRTDTSALVDLIIPGPRFLMPYFYAPTAIVILSDIPAAHMWLQQPPVAWPSTAIQWNAEAGTSYDGGRYISSKGELAGHAEPKRQDAYLSQNSTGTRAGRAFNVISGFWRDDYASAQYSQYGLTMPASGESPYQFFDPLTNAYKTVDRWEVQSSDTTDTIEGA